MSDKALDPEAAARVITRRASRAKLDKALRHPTAGTDLEAGRRVICDNQVRSQGEFAAVIIELCPDVGPEQLTEDLRTAFPGANVGPRHGPHYLSLSRTGKLKNPLPRQTEPA